MKRFSLLALWLSCTSVATAARRSEVPPPTDLFAIALSPTASYAARGRVQAFPRTGKSRTQSVTVTAAPGGKLRRELSSNAKKPASIVYVSDGRTQSLTWVKRGKRWAGPVDAPADQSTPYDLSSSSGARVAGRSTWRLDFHAKAGGVLRRSWWLDRKTGVVLRRESFRPDGTLARRERFSTFELKAPAADAFTVPAAPPAQPWAGPGVPTWRPAGFLPVEDRRSETGRLLGYGDGYAAFTIESGPVGAASGKPTMTVTGDGAAIVWRCGERSCRLSGDLLEDEAMRVMHSLEGAP